MKGLRNKRKERTSYLCFRLFLEILLFSSLYQAYYYYQAFCTKDGRKKQILILRRFLEVQKYCVCICIRLARYNTVPGDRNVLSFYRAAFVNALIRRWDTSSSSSNSNNPVGRQYIIRGGVD